MMSQETYGEESGGRGQGSGTANGEESGGRGQGAETANGEESGGRGQGSGTAKGRRPEALSPAGIAGGQGRSGARLEAELRGFFVLAGVLLAVLGGVVIWFWILKIVGG